MLTSVAHHNTQKQKRKINSVLPSVAGHTHTTVTHTHISGVGNRADIFVAITDGQTDRRTDGRTDKKGVGNRAKKKMNKPPQDISLSIEMNQGAAQGHLDCLYQNPKLTKIPCFRHSGMSGESIERQASLASQRNALSAHSERSLRSRHVDRCARITIRCSLRSHTPQHAKAENEK